MEIAYRGRIARQLQQSPEQCLSDMSSFTDGQVQMVECDWDDLLDFTVEISPNDGIYKGGRYKFKVSITNTFFNLIKQNSTSHSLKNWFLGNGTQTLILCRPLSCPGSIIWYLEGFL